MSTLGKQNKVGRPLMFQTPEDLEREIKKYFESVEPDEITLTGLCLAIGTNKQVLSDYQSRDGYSDIVDKAKLIVENS